MKTGYRIGIKIEDPTWPNQKTYIVKEAPGWKIVHRAKSLKECAEWLITLGVDIRLVPVLDRWPWKMLGEHIAEMPVGPLRCDTCCCWYNDQQGGCTEKGCVSRTVQRPVKST